MQRGRGPLWTAPSDLARRSGWGLTRPGRGGCLAVATRARQEPTPRRFLYGPASELQRRSITASPPPGYCGTPPPLVTPRSAAPCACASTRPSPALRMPPAIMNDRTEIESHSTSVIHPTPCFRSGRSLRETKEAADKLVPESLAARLAWRSSAVAPWLCVTAFRRLCSWQRFASSRVHGSARGPGHCATVAPPMSPGSRNAWRYPRESMLRRSPRPVERTEWPAGAPPVCGDRLQIARLGEVGDRLWGLGGRAHPGEPRVRAGARFEPPPSTRVS